MTYWKCCRKRLENPISIVLSNSIVWKCCPWYGNFLEILWKYSGNKTSIHFSSKCLAVCFAIFVLILVCLFICLFVIVSFRCFNGGNRASE